MININGHTRVRLLAIDDPVLEANPDKVFDYTKLTAISTCPTYGMIRYGIHRTAEGVTGGRSMALEAGKACHEFFAAVRLHCYASDPFHDVTLYADAFKELFPSPETRAAMIEGEIQNIHSDKITRTLAFTLPALHMSGFYDDPLDKRRTMANLEEACVVYAERVLRKSTVPAIISIPNRDAVLGIEVPFALAIDHRQHPTWYYVGRIDGVMQEGDKLVAEENKTTGRIDAAWRMSFHMTHQITGYSLAVAALAHQDTNENLLVDTTIAVDGGLPAARLLGVQIPQPKKFGETTAVEDMQRTWHSVISFLDWAQRQIYLSQNSEPHDTYQNTHACSRYFRACEFIPLCVMSPDERREAITDLPERRWNPLEHAKEKGNANSSED